LYKLDEFKQLVKDFSDVADFLVVYLAEAHATDAWAFANNIDISVHKTLEERLAAARTLVKEDPLCPVVVDEMTNITASKYGALPERLYVIQSGNVFYQVSILQCRQTAHCTQYRKYFQSFITALVRAVESC
uniref:Iodothyronine deiodinase n=1 Tax=Sinocyclocheilus rhinocerous TaxID=307959 RepID=A0A673M7L6_9TELE